jgi:hypothetical protein
MPFLYGHRAPATSKSGHIPVVRIRLTNLRHVGCGTKTDREMMKLPLDCGGLSRRKNGCESAANSFSLRSPLHYFHKLKKGLDKLPTPYSLILADQSVSPRGLD